MLERCLESVIREGADTPCRIVLVDNGSGDGMAERLPGLFPQIEIVALPGNLGFAGGVNRGLAELTEPCVLLLNPDAVLAPGSLARMAADLQAAGRDVAGIAPKMMSSSHEGVIDAVGIVVPPDGAAFNRGIGQCDLGQYDRSEDVAGACFGAALIRRSLFAPGAVGPLHEGYFLYFEDSDWCMRAVSQGYRFLVSPDAVVTHMHSGVTRNEALAFKYRLIELNTLRMVTRNFDSPLLTARIVSARVARLLARTFIRRKFIRANLGTIFAYLTGLPSTLRQRREIKSKRVISDARIFGMAAGEDAYFDTVAYRPDRCLDSLIDSYKRLVRVRDGAEAGGKLVELYRLRESAGEDGAGIYLDAGTLELFAGEPPCVQALLRQAAAAPAGRPA